MTREPSRGAPPASASSLRHDLPLVTADMADFQRVPGLQLVAYR